MVIVDTNWKVFRYRVAYFPTQQLSEMLIHELATNELLRIRQTPAELDNSSNLLRRTVFKSIRINLSEDLSVLRRKMDETCRRWLRKAEKFHGEIEIRRNSPAATADFITLYNRFASRSKHSGPLSPGRLQRFAGMSDLLVLYSRSRPVCGHFWLRDEVASRVRLLFSASSRLEGKEDAILVGALNRYLHWHEIEFFKSEQFDTYDLGGFEAEEDLEDSLTRYKLSLGGSIVRENNYCVGRGVAKLVFKAYEGLPQLNAHLRGRLPA
ncbi:MAG: GNAT family N-acetyltransferase [Candidatus Binataceae bacterium]